MSIFAKDPTAYKKFASTLPVPDFTETPFHEAKPLDRCKVAIVTTAALHHEGKHGFEVGDGDSHYETLPTALRNLSLGHLSVNFDRGGFAADLNVVYPIDRLYELAEEGTIASVANNHYSFAGNQPATVSEIRFDSAPSCAEQMLADDVDVVLLTGT